MDATILGLWLPFSFFCALIKGFRGESLLAKLFFIAATAFILTSCKTQNADKTEPKTEDVTLSFTDSSSAEKVPLEIALPGGQILKTYEGSMEALLLSFVKDTNAMPGKDNWFNFNNLNFEFGTDKILPESMQEVNNIALILKSYPKVRIKIGGYTDKLENEAENLKISTARAKAVLAELKKLGVGGQLEGAEGYGSQFAQYGADANETDRKQDRRISISVRAK